MITLRLLKSDHNTRCLSTESRWPTEATRIWSQSLYFVSQPVPTEKPATLWMKGHWLFTSRICRDTRWWGRSRKPAPQAVWEQLTERLSTSIIPGAAPRLLKGDVFKKTLNVPGKPGDYSRMSHIKDHPGSKPFPNQQAIYDYRLDSTLIASRIGDKECFLHDYWLRFFSRVTRWSLFKKTRKAVR